MSTTTNYSWTLPTVGGSVNTWGTLVNAVLTDIDAKMVSKTDAQTLTNKTLAAPVITGGASISGNVSVAGSVSATGASSNNQLILERTGSATGKWEIYTRSNSLFFCDNVAGDERMSLDASGNLLVGAASGSSHRLVKDIAGDQVVYITNLNASNPYGIYVNYAHAAPNGTTNYFISFQDTGGIRFHVKSNGGVANYSANNVNLSDARLKTDFQPAKSYYDKWTDIDFITYLYKDQTDTERNLGVTAQQLESVFPELIDNSGFGEAPEGEAPYKAVYQTDFGYATARALQEAIEQIEILKAKVAALEARA